jgi:hypothetical protein
MIYYIPYKNCREAEALGVCQGMVMKFNYVGAGLKILVEPRR